MIREKEPSCGHGRWSTPSVGGPDPLALFEAFGRALIGEVGDMTVRPKGKSMSDEAQWEVEIRIRRNGKLRRRESALGSDALTAFENASNDLARELQTDAAVR